MTTVPAVPGQRPPTGRTPLDPQAVDRLEAAFLEEMLKYMGPTGTRDASASSGGESEFQTFLTRIRAEQLSQHLDLGLGGTNRR